MVQGNTVTRRFAVDAAYEKAVPEILKLLRTPRWKGLMRYVSSFNVEPLYYIQVILPHRKKGPDDPQTALRSEEHTSELQSLMRISYAVFCLKKKIDNILHLKHTSNDKDNTHIN